MPTVSVPLSWPRSGSVGAVPRRGPGAEVGIGLNIFLKSTESLLVPIGAGRRIRPQAENTARVARSAGRFLLLPTCERAGVPCSPLSGIKGLASRRIFGFLATVFGILLASVTGGALEVTAATIRMVRLVLGTISAFIRSFPLALVGISSVVALLPCIAYRKDVNGIGRLNKSRALVKVLKELSVCFACLEEPREQKFLPGPVQVVPAHSPCLFHQPHLLMQPWGKHFKPKHVYQYSAALLLLPLYPHKKRLSGRLECL